MYVRILLCQERVQIDGGRIRLDVGRIEIDVSRIRLSRGRIRRYSKPEVILDSWVTHTFSLFHGAGSFENLKMYPTFTVLNLQPMNQMFPLYLSMEQLRQANRGGWLDVTGMY